MSVGESYGKYFLLKRLATGGMGEVFLARQQGPAGFEKILVIKRVLPHLSENDDYATLFISEAKIQATMTHSSIVQIFDLGQAEDGTLYMAMEYVHGKTLVEVLTRARKIKEKLPASLTAQVIERAADALAYAHNMTDNRGSSLNIVHRDISPHNVLVSYRGDIKLIDFGIAKSEMSVVKTESGTIKGKFYYMSPEQSAALPLDRRSDIFSLGICLYECLAGENPFQKPNVVLSLEAIQREQLPPPSSLDPELAPFDAIVEKTLAKDRDERYADAEELKEDLVRVRGQLPPPHERLGPFVSRLFKDQIDQESKVLLDTDGANLGQFDTPTRARRPESGSGRFPVAQPTPSNPRVAAVAPPSSSRVPAFAPPPRSPSSASRPAARPSSAAIRARAPSRPAMPAPPPPPDEEEPTASGVGPGAISVQETAMRASPFRRDSEAPGDFQNASTLPPRALAPADELAIEDAGDEGFVEGGPLEREEPTFAPAPGLSSAAKVLIAAAVLVVIGGGGGVLLWSVTHPAMGALPALEAPLPALPASGEPTPAAPPTTRPTPTPPAATAQEKPAPSPQGPNELGPSRAPAVDPKKAEEERKLAEARVREEQKRAAEEAKKAEAARKAEEARLAADAKKAEATRKAEEARLAADAKKAEAARKAEEARLAANAKKAEAARKAEEAHLAANAKKAEEARKREEGRLAAEAKKAEDGRKREEAKKAAEEKRLAEAKAKEEANKQAEAKKKAEAERRAVEKPPVRVASAEPAKTAGKLLVRTVPPAPVVHNGKVVTGTDFGLVAGRGTIEVGDAATPFKVKLAYRTADGSPVIDMAADPWAIVYVNNLAKGRTPVFGVAIGEEPIRVEFKRPGQEKSVTLLMRYSK